MNNTTFTVSNISCGHCVKTIESELSELGGVQSVKASAETKQVIVTWDAPTDETALRATLTEIGYPAA
jgi:copper chaperone